MEYRSNCPFCDPPDTGAHLYWNSDKESWFCFRCGRGGHGENPGSEGTVHHKSFPEIKLSPNPLLLHDLLLQEHQSYVTKAARKYLLDHHLDPERVSYERRLLVDGLWLVFPVYKNDRMIYFQKRHLIQKAFLNPDVDSKPLFWTSGTLDQRCVLVESWVNAVRIEKWCNAVAIFGKFLSDQACEEISAKCHRVDILLDAGETEHALKIARKLRHFGVPQVYVKTIHAPIGKDVCDLDDAACRRLLK